MHSLRRALVSAMVVAAGCLSLAGISGCATTGGMSATPPDFDKVGLKPQWVNHVPLATGESIVDYWRVGDSVYVSTNFAHLVRFDAVAGTRAWEIDLQNRTYPIFRPADVPNTNDLLVLTLGEAFLIDKSNGATLKRNHMGFAPSTDPIVTTENTFLVGGLNYYCALYLDTLGGRKWAAYSKNDAFVARPAVQENSVLLASENGHLWRVNTSTGDWGWMDRKVNGRVVGGLAADSRAVYVPCLDSNVYAFDMNTGSLLWSTGVPGKLDKPLVMTRSDVLVPTGSALYSLSAAKGEIRWHVDGVNAVGTITGGAVWVTDNAGRLDELSLDTGEALETTSSGGGTIIKNMVDKQILLIAKTGLVSAYAPK